MKCVRKGMKKCPHCKEYKLMDYTHFGISDISDYTCGNCSAEYNIK